MEGTPQAPQQPQAPWKLCPHCGAQSQTLADKCPNCGKKFKKKQRTFLKVLLAILIAATVLIGGCVALIGGAANEADKSIKRDQNKNAITNSQARSVKLGTTRREVEAQFGPPKDTQESQNSGVGSDTCIYYNIKGGRVLDQWQFCFSGKGKSGKLTGKNRL